MASDETSFVVHCLEQSKRIKKLRKFTEDMVILARRMATNLEDSSRVNSAGSDSRSNPLISAFAGDMITVVPFVLAGGSLSHSDTDGNTMLHAAASGWQEKMVEFLILAGATVNAQNNDGDTALHLLTDRASPTPGPLAKSERSPKEARRSTFTQLFVGGAELTARNNRGHIPLHVAALRGDILALEALLTADPSFIDVPGPTGATALALAISKGYVDCTRLLIQAGADPLLDIRDGIRPIDLLQLSDNPAMRELLTFIT